MKRLFNLLFVIAIIVAAGVGIFSLGTPETSRAARRLTNLDHAAMLGYDSGFADGFVAAMDSVKAVKNGIESNPVKAYMIARTNYLKKLQSK